MLFSNRAVVSFCDMSGVVDCECDVVGGVDGDCGEQSDFTS